jgi:GDP-4-dehydro-6-deoxy-D-mannose reductase
VTRALITGAAGFVGGHLGTRLRSAGVEVHALDRGDADIRDLEAMRALVADAAPDVVYHLAGQSSAARSLDDPIETFETNVVGTVSLLEAVRREAPRARVVVASSADAYGAVPADRLPVDESEPMAPANPYAASKAAQEVVAMQYARTYALDVVVARSFNTVGPGQSSSFALPSFAAQLARIASAGAPAILRVGNLDVRRDFTDVRDAARAVALIGERGERGETYNICSGRDVPLRRALDMLIAASGVEVRVEVAPERIRPADVPRLVGSYRRLNAATGWEPHIVLEQSLADLYASVLAALG